MQAAYALGDGRIRTSEVPIPEPGEHDVLVRTHYAAICGSDLHIVFGDPPDEPNGFGHESVGTIVRSNEPGYPEGQLVLVATPPQSSRAFADFQAVPAGSVVPLPAGSDPRLLVMAQQLGTVIYAMKKFWPAAPVRTAVVTGCGPAGLNFVQLLRRRGAERIVASDLRPWRAERARRLGATHTVLAGDGDIVEEVMGLTDGQGAELVIEAAGRNATRRQAMLCAAADGRVGFYGLPEPGAGDTPMPYGEIFRKAPDLRIANAAQYEPGLASFREAVRMINEREVEPTELISHDFPLERLEEAFHIAHELTDSVLKITIKID